MLRHILRNRLLSPGTSSGHKRALSIITPQSTDSSRRTPLLLINNPHIRCLNTSTSQPRKVPKSTLNDVPSQAESVGEPAVEDARKGKLWDSADEAIKDLKSGSTVLSAGFGLCGVAETIITALKSRPDLTDLKMVSNNAGITHTGGLAPLISSGQISKMTLSYVGTNKELERAYLDGGIELELSPQGSIAERLRCAGHGMPGLYTRTGVDTVVERGEIPARFDKTTGEAILSEKKETRVIDGKKYLWEPAIRGDVAILRAWKVDKAGNCRFRYTTRAFAGLMAKAARLSVVEAENIVEIGELGPMDIDLPGIYIDRIVPATVQKSIEITTLRKTDADVAKQASGQTSTSESTTKREARLRREKIARRAAKELKHGYYVNLGVGMPVLAASYLEPDVKVWIQSENGILGMGEYPTEEEVDADIINAGKETVTLVPGASCFDSSESFGMIRGGHVDVSILGAMEVSAQGDLANFMIPGKLVKGMGGAMDLCSNPDQTKVIVVTDHLDKSGKSKVVHRCALPLTASRAVSRIITDLAVFDVDRISEGGLRLVELAEGCSVDELRRVTDAEFEVAEQLGSFK